MRRWRGLKSLVHDAVDHTADLVEEANASVAHTALKYLSLIEPLAEPARTVDAARGAITAGVIGAVKAVNRAVQVATDAGLDLATAGRAEAAESPVPLRSDVMKSGHWVGDAALAAVNAAVGDYLHASDNGLSLGMSLRSGDRYLPLDGDGLRDALPEATGRVAVFVHGLGTTEWSWCLNALAYHGDAAQNFGTLLARDLAITPVFARYNTGRHVSENGRALARLLEALVAHYPVPLTELVLIGHSMGGLVIRSACHYGREEGHAWTALVRRAFCLGSPHQGAALEKIGHVAASVLQHFDAPGAWIPGRVLDGRSAGIKDLRYGYVVDEEWLGLDPDALLDDRSVEVPLLEGVTWYFVAATVSKDAAHPMGQLIGDLLVRVGSASGPVLTRGSFPIETRHFGAVMHHQLQNHPDVYALLRDACAV
jgi:pimeloyl-ACP methyl ester carboxylesterase